MNKFLLGFLTLSLSASALAAAGFSSLEEQMTGKEFMAAGLDKLSQEELSALNAWIRAHSLGTLEAPAATVSAAAAPVAAADQRGFDGDEDDDSPITSRLVGGFSGWDGQTVFKLENGMIWAQADKDTFYVKEVQNPQVTIEHSMFGRWHLRVEGVDSKVRVKRIQ